MVKIVFMRHSEPDYSFVRERKYIGHGLDLGQLTEKGIEMAEKASFDNRLNGAEIIASSPYTRALQTAAILSKNRQLDIKVELDLHEWMPDLTFQYSTYKEAKKAGELCGEYRGICPDNCEIKFENVEDVFNRAKKALLRYMEFKKIIVVTHGVVMKQFISTSWISSIPYCGMLEIDFDESYMHSEFNPW